MNWSRLQLAVIHQTEIGPQNTPIKYYIPIWISEYPNNSNKSRILPI